MDLQDLICNIWQYKTRRFSQKEGEDDENTFAPVDKYTFIRIGVAYIIKLHQMGVESVFIHEEIKEWVSMGPPKDFEGHEGVSCLQIEDFT